MSAVPALPGPIFAQPWWLDAVAPDAWSASTVELDGRLVARLPYVTRSRWGAVTLGGAPLTRYLGPWVDAGDGKPGTRLSREHQRCQELIGGLPPFASFAQRFDPRFTNGLPFRWQGFGLQVRYTYVLEPLPAPEDDPVDDAWRGLRENIRREVRKADRSVRLRDDLGADALLDLVERTYARQGRRPPVVRDIVRRAAEACLARNSGGLLFAQDPSGKVHAGALVVWDDDTAYYVLGGAEPELRSSGAASRVVWEAAKRALASGLAFDFCGSMQPSIERFFRAFGARQVPYLLVTKNAWRPLRLARALRRAWREPS